MKTLTVTELKAQFSSVVDDLKQGREVQVTYGRNKQLLATLVPQSKLNKPNYAVRVGDLQKKGWTYRMKNFEMTDEEFLKSCSTCLIRIFLSGRGLRLKSFRLHN